MTKKVLALNLPPANDLFTTQEERDDVQREKINEKLGIELGDSREQVRRYIRLTELIPQLLDMVDKNQLAMRPAVELSYLSQEHQQALLSVIESEDHTPSHIQATKMRKSFEEESLSNDVILSIMQEDKPNRSEQFKLPAKKIHRFFPVNTSAKVIEETIMTALELWKEGEVNMFKTKAQIHSLQAQDRVLILHENGSNDVVAEYNGKRCTAIFNPFVCLYYVDDIYGVLPDQHKCPACGEFIPNAEKERS